MRSAPADFQKCLQSRSHFLRRLRRPRQKCELARELEESRSTIDRALRELERAAFVERTAAGYRTTLAGELALTEYDRYTARLDGLFEYRELLDGLSTDEPLDTALFGGVDASLPKQCSPHDPVESLATFLSDADHARVFGTAIIPKYVDIYYDRIVEEGMTAEFVLSEGVVEWLLSRREDDAREILGADGVTVAETTTDRSFSLVVTERDGTSASDVRHDQSDRSVGVMLYEDGTFVGFLHNDTREAVAWAEGLFVRIADDAVPLAVRVEN